jgi:hypothetical protein
MSFLKANLPTVLKDLERTYTQSTKYVCVLYFCYVRFSKVKNDS